MIKEAVILAGGFGTRLKSVISDTCKPMALVAGKPFLVYLLNKLAEEHFDHVILAVGYMHENIIRYFHDNYRGMRITYSVENEPLGTGGALKQALTYCEEPWIIVLNGDTYCDISYTHMLEQAINGPSQIKATMAAKIVENAKRYGSMIISEDGYIEIFREKEDRKKTPISLGVYAIERSSLLEMPSTFSLEEDYLRCLAGTGHLKAVVVDAFFIDIGIPEDFHNAQSLLAPLNTSPRLAIFDRDGTINVDTGHLSDPDKLILIPKTLETLQRFANDPEYKIVVATNQSGIAKNLYSEKDMRELHHCLDEVLAKRGIEISAYYYCPHHPDYTGPCSCRKPDTGLLEQAIREFGATPENCIMFGDQPTDLQAATTMGIPFHWAGESI